MKKSFGLWEKNSVHESALQRATLFIFLGTTLWAFLSSFLIGLSDQEAYYWTWSRHLDWCYFEHPPLQAWVTRLLTSILGNDSWVVRLPATLIGRLIGFSYLYLWIKDRYSKSVALYSVQFFSFSLFILAGSIITLPDAYLFPAFCALLYYAEHRRVLPTAIALGTVVLAKWTAVLFVPGVVFRYFSLKQWRRSIKEISTIAAISLLMQTPVVWWNAQNHWASIKFHLHDRHPIFNWAPSAVLTNAIKFIGGQIGLAGFSILILGIFLLNKNCRRKNAANDAKATRSHVIAWVLPAYFIVGYSAIRGELRFYWTAPALLFIIPALIHRIDLKKCGKYLSLAGALGTVISVGLLSSVLYLPVGEYLRPLVETYRTYDIRFSPRGDFEGWRQVASHIKNQGLIKDLSFFVGGSDFRLSSQVAWGFEIDDVRRVVVGSPVKSQFAFWESTLEANPKRHQAFFFGDNRYRDLHFFNGLCTHPLTWNDFNYTMGPYIIKVIKWAECRELLETSK